MEHTGSRQTLAPSKPEQLFPVLLACRCVLHRLFLRRGGKLHSRSNFCSAAGSVYAGYGLQGVGDLDKTMVLKAALAELLTMVAPVHSSQTRSFVLLCFLEERFYLVYTLQPIMKGNQGKKQCRVCGGMVQTACYSCILIPPRIFCVGI